MTVSLAVWPGMHDLGPVRGDEFESDAIERFGKVYYFVALDVVGGRCIVADSARRPIAVEHFETRRRLDADVALIVTHDEMIGEVQRRLADDLE